MRGSLNAGYRKKEMQRINDGNKVSQLTIADKLYRKYLSNSGKSNLLWAQLVSGKSTSHEWGTSRNTWSIIPLAKRIYLKWEISQWQHSMLLVETARSNCLNLARMKSSRPGFQLLKGHLTHASFFAVRRDLEYAGQRLMVWNPNLGTRAQCKHSTVRTWTSLSLAPRPRTASSVHHLTTWITFPNTFLNTLTQLMSNQPASSSRSFLTALKKHQLAQSTTFSLTSKSSRLQVHLQMKTKKMIDTRSLPTLLKSTRGHQASSTTSKCLLLQARLRRPFKMTAIHLEAA